MIVENRNDLNENCFRHFQRGFFSQEPGDSSNGWPSANWPGCGDCRHAGRRGVPVCIAEPNMRHKSKTLVSRHCF